MSDKKSDIKFTTTMLVIAFAIGMAVHFGTNTAKLIWPTPPFEYSITVSE